MSVSGGVNPRGEIMMRGAADFTRAVSWYLGKVHTHACIDLGPYMAPDYPPTTHKFAYPDDGRMGAPCSPTATRSGRLSVSGTDRGCFQCSSEGERLDPDGDSTSSTVPIHYLGVAASLLEASLLRHHRQNRFEWSHVIVGAWDSRLGSKQRYTSGDCDMEKEE
ncbi:hypothetical protein ARMGADRAFT_1032065 [Armillaria gallica]|uniref:Uncharacterized protein n=1 Tax=Armillaria gallica TaxID=47427 RepID=A0A2H3DRS4_ARMGA|nr:hypothetical protein ARMGADRAFT_1032065 [Armillaria gallica]